MRSHLAMYASSTFVRALALSAHWETTARYMAATHLRCNSTHRQGGLRLPLTDASAIQGVQSTVQIFEEALQLYVHRTDGRPYICTPGCAYHLQRVTWTQLHVATCDSTQRSPFNDMTTVGCQSVSTCPSMKQLPDSSTICVCPSGMANRPRGVCHQGQSHAHGVSHFITALTGTTIHCP